MKAVVPPPWKILIVDDDPTVHKLIAKTLPAGDFEVQSLFNPVTAVDEVVRVRPHLVILDLMMPKVSGIEVCQRIKQNPATRETLVLILTAKETQEDRIRGLEIGADDYISKPFHLASLVRKIQYMLSQAKPS